MRRNRSVPTGSDLLAAAAIGLLGAVYAFLAVLASDMSADMAAARGFAVGVGVWVGLIVASAMTRVLTHLAHVAGAHLLARTESALKEVERITGDPLPRDLEQAARNRRIIRYGTLVLLSSWSAGVGLWVVAAAMLANGLLVDETLPLVPTAAMLAVGFVLQSGFMLPFGLLWLRLTRFESRVQLHQAIEREPWMAGGRGPLMTSPGRIGPLYFPRWNGAGGRSLRV